MAKKRKAPETFNEFLGAEVAAYLTKRGKGQDDIVKDLGWKTSTVGRKLRGETGFTVEELIEVAEYLNVETHKIVEAAVDDYGGMTKLVSALPDSNVTVMQPRKNVADMSIDELEERPHAALRDPEMDEPEQFD